jgi:hypothetical protein
MSTKIQLPVDILKKHEECGDQARSWRHHEKQEWDKLVELNKKFFKNACARIVRRLRPVCGYDFRIVDARLNSSIQDHGIIRLNVYLGHPRKEVSFECYIKELDDINQMCKEAIAIYKAFHSVQEPKKKR